MKFDKYMYDRGGFIGRIDCLQLCYVKKSPLEMGHLAVIYGDY